MSNYSENLDKIFYENPLFRGVDTITVYGEFAGYLSFAGQHNWIMERDGFKVTIFDVFMYKKDFVKPRDFIDTFGHLRIPEVVIQGLLDEKMIGDVISNIYGLKEGVVFKGVSEGKVWMAKVKTQQWLNKVRDLYGINNNIE